MYAHMEFDTLAEALEYFHNKIYALYLEPKDKSKESIRLSKEEYSKYLNNRAWVEQEEDFDSSGCNCGVVWGIVYE